MRERHRWLQFRLATLLMIVVVGALVCSRFAVTRSLHDQRPVGRQLNDMAQVAMAIGAFRLDSGRLPTEQEGLGILTASRISSGPYLADELLVDQWGNDIVYKIVQVDSGETFDLVSWGPNGCDDQGMGDDLSLAHGWERAAYPDYRQAWCCCAAAVAIIWFWIYLFRFFTSDTS